VEQAASALGDWMTNAGWPLIISSRTMLLLQHCFFRILLCLSFLSLDASLRPNLSTYALASPTVFPCTMHAALVLWMFMLTVGFASLASSHVPLYDLNLASN